MYKIKINYTIKISDPKYTVYTSHKSIKIYASSSGSSISAIVRGHSSNEPALEILVLIAYKWKPPLNSEKSMFNVATTLAPSILIGSSTYLQIPTTTAKARVSLKFGKIRPGSVKFS